MPCRSGFPLCWPAVSGGRACCSCWRAWRAAWADAPRPAGGPPGVPGAYRRVETPQKPRMRGSQLLLLLQLLVLLRLLVVVLPLLLHQEQLLAEA